jgi:hypothetical protein
MNTHRDYELSARIVAACIVAMVLIGLLAACRTCRAGTIDDAFEATCRIDRGGSGCAFEVSRNTVFVLTAAHVVDRSTAQCEFWVRGRCAGSVQGRVVAKDVRVDAAVIAIPVSSFRVLPKIVPIDVDSPTPPPGADIVTVGCPKGGWLTAYVGYTVQTRLQNHLAFYPPCLEGRSGSAVIERRTGRIIGILRARTEMTGGDGLATPARLAYLALTKKAWAIPDETDGQRIYLTQWCPDGNCQPNGGYVIEYVPQQQHYFQPSYPPYQPRTPYPKPAPSYAPSAPQPQWRPEDQVPIEEPKQPEQPERRPLVPVEQTVIIYPPGWRVEPQPQPQPRCSIENRVSKVEERLGGVESKLGSIEAKIDSSAKQQGKTLSALKDDVNAAKLHAAKAASQANDALIGADTLRKELTPVAQTTEATARELPGLKTGLRDARQALDSLPGVDKLRADARAIAIDVAAEKAPKAVDLFLPGLLAAIGVSSPIAAVGVWLAKRGVNRLVKRAAGRIAARQPQGGPAAPPAVVPTSYVPVAPTGPAVPTGRAWTTSEVVQAGSQPPFRPAQTMPSPDPSVVTQPVIVPGTSRTENVYVSVPVADPWEEAKRRTERLMAMGDAQAAAFFAHRDNLSRSQLEPKGA